MSEIKTADGSVYIKKFIRADINKQVNKCYNCGKDIIRQDLRTIVYYCSKACRRAYRKGV